jgi:hypothetical protein
VTAALFHHQLFVSGPPGNAIAKTVDARGRPSNAPTPADQKFHASSDCQTMKAIANDHR